ncbi:LysE family translocator [Donghicola sp. XS_ASV15]|uniref:LysE family translocator n=1 Tax=Donghicola sp. XS_ASV15 TaxID=3241295 RepID=UPI00351612AB
MLTFAAAVFFLIITPGPGVLSTAGVGASFGRGTGLRYVLGLFLGTNLVAAAVVSGLAALVLAEPQLRTVLFAISFAYLVYLAFRIAFAGSKLAFIERATPPGVSGGILLQIMNPKAYAVNTALYTGFGFMPANYWVEMLAKFLIMNAIWIPIHLLWLWVGIKVHQLYLSPRTHSIINKAMAVSMLLVVLLAGSELL